MRVLFFILIASAFGVSAQIPNAKQSFEAATEFAQVQQYERAIEQYQETIYRTENDFASNDFRAQIHFNIGVCYYQLKKPAKAVEEFTEAINLSRKTYQKAFYALGMAQIDLKNRLEAIRAFRQAVRLKPNDGEAWFDLALVFLEEKDFDSAENAFRNTIKYKSINAADAHNNIGVILALKSDFASAENAFKRALTESNSNSVEARNNLEFCRLYKRNFNANLLAKLEFSSKNKGE